MKDKPRIGTCETPGRVQIFNANYAASGGKLANFERPWTIFADCGSATYPTFQEAIESAGPTDHQKVEWTEIQELAQ